VRNADMSKLRGVLDVISDDDAEPNTSRREPSNGSVKPVLAPIPWQLALLLCIGVVLGCTRPFEHHMVDAVMSSAYRPVRPEPPLSASSRAQKSQYLLLSGDLHCHVSPPDAPSHVSRGIAETVELARSEGLDFVVLTPHVRIQSFQSDYMRRVVMNDLAALEKSLPAKDPAGPIFVVGFEYTDFGYGHIGGAFADLQAVFDDVSADAALTDPAKFFEAYVKRGGLLVVNHPLLEPIDSVFSMARANLSWRPFTEPGPYPEEIVALDRFAQAFEVYNLAVSELRDRVLLRDPGLTLEATFQRLDREIKKRGRPMVPVGGSDSHSGHLRATTFVLAAERSAAGVRDALVAGRVCVRDAAACTFEARVSSGPWMPPGSSLRDTTMVEARAHGAAFQVVVDGVELGPEEPPAIVSIPVKKDRCTVLRARVGGGFSGPVYVNCPF
jgi:hypothetical protein